MDVIRFENPTAATKMEHGRIVNNLKSKMWIERYAEAGEFKFVADASSDARAQLPIGSFVSHTDSGEIMIVESHEINTHKDRDSDIVITGRGFETHFENFVVGANFLVPTVGGAAQYYMAANWLSLQIVSLISNHILASHLLDDNDALSYVSVSSQVQQVEDGAVEARSIEHGTLYDRVLELLAVKNFGIRVARPGSLWSPLPYGDDRVAVLIHTGEDNRGVVVLSYDAGEIESADYLWSNKNKKNAAMIYGTWVKTVVRGVETGYNRRWMIIDASDIDHHYTSAPTGVNLATVIASMETRGRAALAAQNDIALTNVEVAKNVDVLESHGGPPASRAKYRWDYDLGDLITVLGTYNDSTTMRVGEYVEIEDETGSSGYPTLTVV